MPTSRYERLNNYIMGVIYAPVLLITAFIETCQAFRIRRNRRRGEIQHTANVDVDDEGDDEQEWEEMARVLDAEVDDFESEGWIARVETTRPNVEVDPCILEMRELRAQVVELKAMVKGLGEQQQSNGAQQEQQLVDVDGS